ncbi:Transmembrane protein 223 [Lonchura striata]|uniref:Transmembrane protein 223 n=1 Tax=Lonchura striata TaxID=40157 RepID=A0A218UB82_9PASE|nr:transmembrane protein 223 [Lonchura striata domestica]OWK51007.1 Transmembrane protein 223 [Lonchura striata domestica]
MAARAALEVAAAAAARDVVLYEHDRSRFFRLVGLFCAGQGLFWAYLAHFAFTALRPAPDPDPGPGPGPGPGHDDPLRPRDNKWRFAFTASCLTVGSLTVAAGWLLPLRSVQRVTLLRGGAAVALSTPGPLGLGRRSLTVPLRDVSGRAHRSQAAAAVPVKLRGRPFFFLLDTGGIREPRLFDVTVGAFRGF